MRALLVLGQQTDRVTSISEIANKTMVTVKYLEQIMNQLKRLGYVQSQRGVQGGYTLRLTPGEIHIGDIIRKLEGPLSPMPCASITAYEPCELEVGCLLKPLWMLIRDTIAHVLDQTTLEDLLQRKVHPLNLPGHQLPKSASQNP